MTDVDPFVQAEEGSGQRKQRLVTNLYCVYRADHDILTAQLYST